jgi:hypothetical protein
MDNARDLANLRHSVPMLGDEHLLEGWAALAGRPEEPVLGLVLLTDQRLIFIDVDAVVTAFPIFKILTVVMTGARAAIFTVWYGTLALTFDSPQILAAMLNLLRQDPSWVAQEAFSDGACVPTSRRSTPGPNGDVASQVFRQASGLPDPRQVRGAPLETT